MTGDWSAPDVDIFDADDKLVLLVYMPGVSNPDVNIEGNELRIEARSEYSEPRDATRMSAEFEPANFRRAFVLPVDVEPSKISAKVTNGVLRLEVPKAEEAKVHRIEVKSD
jgi:HSP20 family molecular chaperone IbpA